MTLPLYKGDQVELTDPIPGQPLLQAGLRGIVLLGPHELQANGDCTVQLKGPKGRHTWQLPTERLRYLGPPQRRRRAGSTT